MCFSFSGIIIATTGSTFEENVERKHSSGRLSVEASCVLCSTHKTALFSWHLFELVSSPSTPHLPEVLSAPSKQFCSNPSAVYRRLRLTICNRTLSLQPFSISLSRCCHRHQPISRATADSALNLPTRLPAYCAK